MEAMPQSLPASLPHAFQDAARRHPDKPLLTFEGNWTSYGEMLEHVRDIAGTLASFGLVKGERVGLYLENSPSFVSAYLGVLWAGGVIVPINTRYRRGELSHMLRDAEPRLVLTDAAGAEELAAVAGDVPRLALTGDMHHDRDRWRTLALQAAPLVTPHPLGLGDLAMIAYTSGTTGKSKGAMLTHGNFLHNSAAVTQAWRWRPEDVLILALPLFHMHGLGVGLHGTLLQGSSLHLLRRFDAEAVFGAMLGADTTMFFGVPTMYHRLLEVARRRPETPDMRLLVSGSAPLAPQTHREVEEVFGQRILERYGMTETVMNLGNPYDGERRPGTVGMPFPGVEVRIADPATDRPVPPGEVGEIQVRGPNVMRGYWRDPEATARAFTEDGYFRTGDLGFTDAEGYTTLSGRAKDLIISGGFNVYPREVEDVIAEVPGVQEVAVLGVSDPDLGEKVVAVVVGDAADAAILEHCRARVADFKKPRAILRVPTLPRNAMGKVQKHLLAEELETRKLSAISPQPSEKGF
jgi:malonyl-CoA/methylmalonyl-CoA synthetase